MTQELASLTAARAAEAIREGAITSEELVSACLARIEAREPLIGAWAYLDRDYALEQARRADEQRREGRPVGPLHGVPVGVKDIFETMDMPTENGTVLHAGYRPATDAKAVSLLREAGAVILGKTVTTELAVYAPGKTRNPHDANRTPGGSSSGSAAAVAADMVPLAIGSQTNGSVIRPASFCGVFGFKPTHGLISRQGMLRQSRRLDHVGVFARSLEDVALLAECLMAYDERDPDMRLRARPRLTQVMMEEPPVAPRFAFVKTPFWEQTEEDTREGFAELIACLQGRVEELTLSEIFQEAVQWHRTIMEADLARSFQLEYERGRDRLSPQLVEMIERGRRVLAVDYNRAVDRIQLLNEILDDYFYQYDAFLTPAAPGEAPPGLESTGNPIFCTLWTLCGVPALCLPLLTGRHGLPIGVQLVGQYGDDARLLRTARWLERRLATAAE
ncbi:amidase [Pelomicrobium methylotrophicum]|uniref:Amidase n=1 Tax=Pelomicrobium methylotrophicum TaxID=2602750 RepID=A0A5C7EVV5_9PROT|nr:amidase [Pelomicrobium methylotrophicum]TXF13056.1 amidase [Pelomicrobium methylotrophicum]